MTAVICYGLLTYYVLLARPRWRGWVLGILGAGPALAGRPLLVTVDDLPIAVGMLLARAIIEAPPVVIRDGGVIAPGYDTDLDELKRLSQDADQFLADLESRERERTGIANLKVGYNRVHGYYIEISRGQADKAPPEYTRRQTLKAAERFITEELKSFEDKVLSAREALEDVEGYDSVFFDTPPAFNFYTLSALIAADRCVIPFDCDDFSRRALYSLLENVEETRGDHNPDLEVEGIVINQFMSRANLPQRLVGELI